MVDGRSRSSPTPVASRCSRRRWSATTAARPPARWLLDTHVFADEIERQLDELGWQTAHIVGNSLGGWVSFELERRGRARSVTAIAPAGGWSQYSPVKFEIVGKFIAGRPSADGRPPVRAADPAAAVRPPHRDAGRSAVRPTGPDDADLLTLIDDATHCPAYLQLLIKSLTAPGLEELADSQAPVHLVTCEFDRVVAASRGSAGTSRRTCRRPHGSADSTGVGHIPMLEAPGRVTELIADFVDEHTAPATEERRA